MFYGSPLRCAPCSEFPTAEPARDEQDFDTYVINVIIDMSVYRVYFLDYVTTSASDMD